MHTHVCFRRGKKRGMGVGGGGGGGTERARERVNSVCFWLTKFAAHIGIVGMLKCICVFVCMSLCVLLTEIENCEKIELLHGN